MPIALLLLMALAPSATPAPASPLARLSCAPFAWVKDGMRERAAMTTRVTVKGNPLTVQIDTGADESVIYASAADALGLGKTDKAVVDGGVMEVGGARIAGPSLFVNRDMKGGDGIDGTLGLQSLLGRVTVIDYPGQRLCILNEAEVADSLWTAPKWTPATLRNGKLFVPIHVGDAVLSDVAFDTGSSLFPLVVDGAPWRSFTGKADAKAASQSISGMSWGKPVTFAGDPAKSAMSLGKVDLGTPLVFTNTGDPTDFATWPFHIDGLIGNAPLWNSVVVLDLTVHMRFGVIK